MLSTVQGQSESGDAAPQPTYAHYAFQSIVAARPHSCKHLFIDHEVSIVD